MQPHSEEIKGTFGSMGSCYFPGPPYSAPTPRSVDIMSKKSRSFARSGSREMSPLPIAMVRFLSRLTHATARGARIAGLKSGPPRVITISHSTVSPKIVRPLVRRTQYLG